MHVTEGLWENDPDVKITSRVGGKNIGITPADIAKYLKYQRPPPTTVNYPRKDESINQQLINETLYLDPAEAQIPHVPTKFKGSYRFLSKVINFDLYAQGTEHKPSKKSGEILYEFTAVDIVVDWAMFIFAQLGDFIGDTLIMANMPFPCMIMTLCKKKGVRGTAYN